MSFYVGSLGGIPIYVNAWALLLVAYLAFVWGDPLNGAFAALGILASVLIHELGHAIVAAQYRLQPMIELHFMGGNTRHMAARSDAHDALILAAGPGVQFVFALLAIGGWAVLAVTAPDIANVGVVAAFLTAFIWVGTFWAIINALPLWPMDGGRLFRLGLVHLLKLRPGRADRITHITSIVIGGLLIAAFLASGIGGFISVFLFGMMIFQNIQALREAAPDVEPRGRKNPTASVRPKQILTQARAAFAAGDWSEAARLAHQARAERDLPESVLPDIYEIIALSHIRDGRLDEGVRFARRAPAKPDVVEAQVQALLTLGQRTEAKAVLRERGASLPADVRARLEEAAA